MSYLVLDTETTGLPLTRSKNFKNIENFAQCRIVSLAIVQYSAEHEELRRVHELITPDGYEVKATEIHGITHEAAVTLGKPFLKMYQVLDLLLEVSPIIIGHNVEFDMNVIMSESFRKGLPTTRFESAKIICTLKMVKEIYNKPMKLGIIYKLLFDADMEGAHDALADTLGTARVYQKLLEHKTPETVPVRSKRVVIKASEVAACIGKNPYKKMHEVLDDMWKKYSPETFKGVTKREREEKVVQSSTEAQNILKDAVESAPTTSDRAQEVYQKAVTQIESNQSLTASDKKDLTEYIRSQVYTSFGTKYEDRTSDKVELDEGVTLVKDDSFYNLPVTDIHGTKYVVTGKIDRIEVDAEGKRTLVEIKNRTRGLFGDVRSYEMIQVQVYLEMLDLEDARLIEQFNDQTSSKNIKRDRELMRTVILPKLVQFCEKLHINMSV